MNASKLSLSAGAQGSLLALLLLAGPTCGDSGQEPMAGVPGAPAQPGDNMSPRPPGTAAPDAAPPLTPGTPPAPPPTGGVKPPTPMPPTPPPGTPPPPAAACADANAKLMGLKLVTVATAARPIHLVGHPSDPDTALIAERGGTVRVAKGLATATTPVTLSEPILQVQTTQGGERGLLSLAIHPNDPTKLYVFFNDGAMGNASVVQEFTRNLQTGMATAGKELYRAAHSANNHQGGNLAFGADKMLYFGIGDNAGGRAPSLNPNTNFGKILRMDPATGMAPPGNQMGLIWAMGLRNPWRMSFDRMTGDLYIGDVGEGTEEVNMAKAGRAGINFGWSGGGEGEGAPIVRYQNGQGQNCVIGGYVYRGSKNACMAGRYFYKDRARGATQSFAMQDGKVVDERTHPTLTATDLYSFGEDGAGELYMLSGNGRVARIVE